MMNNLFSSFDPSTSPTNLSMNWISLVMIFLITPMKYWNTPSKFLMTIKLIIKHMNKESKVLMSKKDNLNSIIYSSILMILMTNNFMGLFPYIFTGTSHMSMNLTLALVLWMSIIMYTLIKKTNKMLAHLLPLGTPAPLMSFMVIIESISSMIRPIALSVRLSANMIAGHLLLTLMSSTGINLSQSMLMLMLTAQMSLIILEMAVSMIQAYVFSILLVLYASEV